MNYTIAAIPGDGIGPEVVREAALILQKIGEEFNHKFQIKYALAGGCAIDEVGVPLPDETLKLCESSDEWWINDETRRVSEEIFF